jgi:hypothetical protein
LCTGHFDHLELGADPVEWGICPVSHGDLVSAWGDYGRAPEVRTEWIVNATEAFLHNRRLFTSNAREHAAAVRENWSWERVSQPLIDWVRSELS